MWYGRDGQVLPEEEAYTLLNDNEYRRVGLDYLGRYRISTVLLMLDHNFSQEGPPIIFETMIFNGDDGFDLYCTRYSTLEQAQEGHIVALEQAAAWEDRNLRRLNALRGLWGDFKFWFRYQITRQDYN